MNNILEATLQIKDKNIIWNDKVQEKIFKKRKSLFYSATCTHKPEFCAVCYAKQIYDTISIIL